MTVTLDEAVAMIADKAGKSGGRRPARAKAAASPARKKATAAKPAAGKAAARRKA